MTNVTDEEENAALGSRAEQIERAERQASDKLAFANRIPELVQKFECLKLTDLFKMTR
jgi:hypothetical protein